MNKILKKTLPHEARAKFCQIFRSFFWRWSFKKNAFEIYLPLDQERNYILRTCCTRTLVFTKVGWKNTICYSCNVWQTAKNEGRYPTKKKYFPKEKKAFFRYLSSFLAVLRMLWHYEIWYILEQVLYSISGSIHSNFVAISPCVPYNVLTW